MLDTIDEARGVPTRINYHAYITMIKIFQEGLWWPTLNKYYRVRVNT